MIRFSGQKHVVYHMDFFPDSSYLVTIGGKSKAIWVWNLKQPKKAVKYQLPEVPAPYWGLPLRSIVVSQDSEIIVPVDSYSTLANPSQPRHQCQMYYIAWPAQTHTVVQDEIWCNDITTAKKRTSFLRIGYHPAWSSFGPTVEWKSVDIEHTVRSKIWSSDGLEWFAQRAEEGVRTYNFLTKRYSAYQSFKYNVDGVTFSQSGKYFVVNCISEYFQVFETATFKPVGKEIKTQLSYTKPQFTPDDKKLLIAAGTNIHVFDTQTSEELASYDFQIGHIVEMRISDDGLMFAVSGTNKEIVVADLET